MLRAESLRIRNLGRISATELVEEEKLARCRSKYRDISGKELEHTGSVMGLAKTEARSVPDVANNART